MRSKGNVSYEWKIRVDTGQGVVVRLAGRKTYTSVAMKSL